MKFKTAAGVSVPPPSSLAVSVPPPSSAVSVTLPATKPTKRELQLYQEGKNYNLSGKLIFNCLQDTVFYVTMLMLHLLRILRILLGLIFFMIFRFIINPF